MQESALTQKKKISEIVTGMRVLVGDDLPTMRNILVNTLRSMGFTKIDAASNGKVMLTNLETRKYDLILCDWNMPPFMDGVEVLETLKENGRLDDLIFIMVTAERLAHNVIRAAEAILDAYIVKPVRTETVEKILTKVLLKKDILRKGKKLLDTGGVNKAVEYYENELNQMENSGKSSQPPLWLHKAIAETYERAGELKKAFAKQLDILKINPESAWTYEAMGQIYKKNNNTEKAIEAFQRALKCNQHFMKASDSLATIYLENNRTDDALAIIEKASEYGTDNVKRQILLEEIYVKKKDYGRAAEVARHIIELQPRINVTENYTRLAKNLLFENDNLGLAYDALTAAITKRDPITTTSNGLRNAYLMKGEVCLRFDNKERQDEAEKGFRYILIIQKKDTDDKTKRTEIESKILQIYKRLGKEREGTEILKKIDIEYKKRKAIS